MKSKTGQRGGKRQGAGRKRGALTQRTQEIVAKAAAGGVTPLEYMLDRLHDAQEDAKVRLQCARDAAPYVHPRLAAVEHSGGLDLAIGKYSDDELDAAIQTAAAEAAVVIKPAGKSPPAKAP